MPLFLKSHRLRFTSFLTRSASTRLISSSISASSAPAARILVVGGAYGGLAAINNLLELSAGKPQLPSPLSLQPLAAVPDVKPKITLLDERDGIFHTAGAPLAHTSRPFVSEAWKRYADIPRLTSNDVKVLQGRVTGVDMNLKMATYRVHGGGEETLEYDYLLVATGLRRNWPIVPRALDRDVYVKDTREYIDELEAANRIAVVGGGAVGVEVSSELKTIFPEKDVTLVHSHETLMNQEPLPQEVKQKAHEMLQECGVNIKLDHRATGSIPKLILSNGEELAVDKVIYTTTTHLPNTDFLPSEVKTNNGYITTLPTLQVATGAHNCCHFAIGDVAAQQVIKRAGGAIYSGYVAANNIMLEILAAQGKLPKAILAEIPDPPTSMVLVVGESAVAYQPATGMHAGEELYRDYVGRGLGIDVAWKLLGI